MAALEGSELIYDGSNTPNITRFAVCVSAAVFNDIHHNVGDMATLNQGRDHQSAGCYQLLIFEQSSTFEQSLSTLSLLLPVIVNANPTVDIAIQFRDIKVRLTCL